MKAVAAGYHEILYKYTVLFLALFLMAACSDHDPVKVGFLAGISGRVADLGIGGRNGVLLAVEMRNASGGIAGRPVKLIVEDDKQNATRAKEGWQRLIDKNVVAVIGPMTSSMAVALAPLANQSRTLLLSPTATSTLLSGKKDYFMRVVSSTATYAKRSANYHYHHLGARRAAVIYDKKNLAYTQSWLADYRKEFERLGGQINPVIPFESNDYVNFAGLVDGVVAGAVDSLLVLANSVDAASIVQKLRQKSDSILFITSEWAATERLIELGGKAVEGGVMAQVIDRNSTEPGYRAFKKAYFQRFGREPGFAGLTGFDAANVIFDALEISQSGQNLRDVILQKSRFMGAQSELIFDEYGDTERQNFLTTIKDGKYVRL